MNMMVYKLFKMHLLHMTYLDTSIRKVMVMENLSGSELHNLKSLLS